jgi:hypothetical protein
MAEDVSFMRWLDRGRKWLSGTAGYPERLLRSVRRCSSAR